MKYSTRLLITSCAAALVVACVSTNAMRLGSGPIRPPVPEHQVAIYRTADQVPGRYEEVALLNSTGHHSMTNEEAMFKSMRKKAAELGANAVILDALTEPSTGSKVASAIFGVGGERKGKAVAIYVFPAGADTTMRDTSARRR
jgi:hypothetical protein